MLKRHLDNLLTYLKHHITNAVTEGLNSKIQNIKAAAPRFPQLSELPHSHPFLLRKARSLPIMNLEESFFVSTCCAYATRSQNRMDPNSNRR